MTVELAVTPGLIAPARRNMPRQKPRESEQIVCTPPEFLHAVQRRFGPIGLDLAATRENRVCPMHFGPGSELALDTLDPKVSWSGRTLRWLNPPFGNIPPFARKCAEQRHHAPIALLTPAGVSTLWFADFIHGKALVLALRPKLIFVGQEQSFPKDLILSVYGPYIAPGFDTWKWK